MLQVNDLRAVKPSLNPCPPSNCLHALTTINRTLCIAQISAPKSFVGGPTRLQHTCKPHWSKWNEVCEYSYLNSFHPESLEGWGYTWLYTVMT